MEPSQDDQRPRRFGRAGGRLCVDARHTGTDVTRKSGGVVRIDECDVDRLYVFAAARRRRFARQRKEIRKVQLHLANDGPQLRWIGRWLVDAPDAKRPTGPSVIGRAEANDVANSEMLSFRELTRDEDRRRIVGVNSR